MKRYKKAASPTKTFPLYHTRWLPGTLHIPSVRRDDQAMTLQTSCRSSSGVYPAQSVDDQHAMQLQAARLMRRVMQEVIFDLERGTLDHKVLRHTIHLWTDNEAKDLYMRHTVDYNAPEARSVLISTLVTPLDHDTTRLANELFEHIKIVSGYYGILGRFFDVTIAYSGSVPAVLVDDFALRLRWIHIDGPLCPPDPPIKIEGAKKPRTPFYWDEEETLGHWNRKD